METVILPERLRKFEIPGHVAIATGNGGLPKINVTTGASTAEIYLHGAHVTDFQKNGEPPLMFMSAKAILRQASRFAAACRFVFRGSATATANRRTALRASPEWQLVKTSAAPDGAVTLRLRCRRIPGRDRRGRHLRTEFIVTVADTLTMELIATNESCGRNAGD